MALPPPGWKTAADTTAQGVREALTRNPVIFGLALLNAIELLGVLTLIGYLVVSEDGRRSSTLTRLETLTDRLIECHKDH